jgi:hypothetical protein
MVSKHQSRAILHEKLCMKRDELLHLNSHWSRKSLQNLHISSPDISHIKKKHEEEEQSSGIKKGEDKVQISNALQAFEHADSPIHSDSEVTEPDKDQKCGPNTDILTQVNQHTTICGL